MGTKDYIPSIRKSKELIQIQTQQLKKQKYKQKGTIKHMNISSDNLNSSEQRND